MGIKIPFAKRESRVVHIDEINLYEKGLACNCTCIDCGEALIAKIAGKKREKHFSHKRDVECAGGGESAIHLFAKQILNEYKQLCLPDLFVEYDDESRNNSEFTYCSNSHESARRSSLRYYEEDYDDYEGDDYYELEVKKQLICNSQLIDFDGIDIEKHVNNIIPDIILYKNGTKLFVEIGVTHFIDKQKLDKIKELNISTIEIDVREHKDSFNKMTYEELKEIFIANINNKKWIYHRKAQSFIEEQKDINNESYKKKQAERKRKEKEREIEALKRQKLRESLALKNNKVRQQIISNKENIYKQMKHSIKNDKFFPKVNAFLSKTNGVPFFLDIETPGDYVFKHYRVIWQTMIYERFVLGRSRKIIRVSNVVKWVNNHSGLLIHNCFKYEANSELGTFDLTSTIHYYLKELEKYKILDVKHDKHKFGAIFEVGIGNYNEYKEMSPEEIEKYRYSFERIQYNRKYPNVVNIGERRYITVSSTNNYKDEVTNNNVAPAILEQSNKNETEITEDFRSSYSNLSGPVTSYDKVGTCKYCGQVTSQWVIYYGDTKLCKCRDCREED